MSVGMWEVMTSCDNESDLISSSHIIIWLLHTVTTMTTAHLQQLSYALNTKSASDLHLINNRDLLQGKTVIEEQGYFQKQKVIGKN